MQLVTLGRSAIILLCSEKKSTVLEDNVPRRINSKRVAPFLDVAQSSMATVKSDAFAVTCF